MRPFERNRNLTEAERTRRIGELIAIAVIRYRHLHPEEFADHPQFAGSPHQDGAGMFDFVGLVSDESEKRILHYLSNIGTAAPKDFQMALGIIRISVTRKFERLRSAKLITTSGKTRAVRYRLVLPHLLRQIQNDKLGDPEAAMHWERRIERA
ncbi:hypothetical protein Ga0100231_000055 [Opitutaceae bacterium TAV4]|nr:hypothetical protein Ga0100231_024895 [Opitutaceae bacterium TAV4]RRK00951.1 hypothetical protein Ga0100230_024620 [Opitutaceae bacterium TAV3]RRK01273.1 hypothetical protein Ga0100231_000055 [Opitutaceae bacterium TAV4]